MVDTALARPIGRPTDYRPEYAKIAGKMAKLGANDPEIADALDCNRSTLWEWRRAFKEFSDAFKMGRDQADNRVVRSLYQRATGYDFRTTQTDGERTVVKHEHQPPDTAAAFIWLKNRRPAEWRDRHEVHITGGFEFNMDLTGIQAPKVVEVQVLSSQEPVKTRKPRR